MEGDSVVDIGYHYVACGANGLPLVSNTNGLPDYVADANGNGLVDTGEIPWTAPPVITVPPVSQTVQLSSNASFSVTATGMYLTYQWYFNGTTLLTGATNRLLTLANVQSANGGTYSVVVSNPVGAVTSTVVGLQVITSEPANVTMPAGGGGGSERFGCGARSGHLHLVV
jgi:hypothetical protein